MVEKTKESSTKPVSSPALKKISVEKKPETVKVQDRNLGEYIEQTADSYKIIAFAETNAGKTRFYLLVPEHLKKKGIPPEKFLMYVINTDRATGITKLAGLIPPEYIPRVHILDAYSYETLIEATKVAHTALMKHIKEVGPHAYLAHELLGVPWTWSQDYYTRRSYGEGLGDFFATKKQLEKAIRDDSSAYRALDGWKDWSVIKLLHNEQWIEPLKNVPYHTIFTAEIREEGREDSIFHKTGRPAGEKYNIHRFDHIICFRRSGNPKTGEHFFMKPIKLTGFSKKYPEQDVTDKNAFTVHEQMLKALEDKGLKESKIQKQEKEAGIVPPEKPKEKPVPPPEVKEEVKETKVEPVKVEGDEFFYKKHYSDGTSKLFKRKATEEDKKQFEETLGEETEEKETEEEVKPGKKEEKPTVKIVSGGKGKEETEGEITKKELTIHKPKEEKKEEKKPAKEETKEEEEW